MIFKRLKALYIAGAVKNLAVYVAKGLITPAQAEEIMKGE